MGGLMDWWRERAILHLAPLSYFPLNTQLSPLVHVSPSLSFLPLSFSRLSFSLLFTPFVLSSLLLSPFTPFLLNSLLFSIRLWTFALLSAFLSSVLLSFLLLSCPPSRLSNIKSPLPSPSHFHLMLMLLFITNTNYWLFYFNVERLEYFLLLGTFMSL